MKWFLQQRQIGSFYALLIVVSLALLAGCGGSAGSAASDLNVQLIPAPEGRNGTYLIVQVTDKEGKPVTNATVELEGNMTHPGMAPVFGDAVSDDADGTSDGIYQVPFAFNMAGDWVITVAIERDGKSEIKDIPVNVGETAVTVE